MKTVVAAIALAMFVSASLPTRAQTPERPQSFEVASVKQNVSGDPRMLGIRTQPGGRFIATNIPLKFLIAAAFRMAEPEASVDARVLGAPEWTDTERYDINAKASIDFPPSPDGPSEALLTMMRSLLAERFQLVTHPETRELPVYDLVMARADGRLGAGMRRNEADCDAALAARGGGAPPQQGGGRGPLQPPPCGLMSGPARTIAGGATLAQVARSLAVRVERPVIDKTGLAGRYAFELVFTPERMPTGTPPPGVPPVDPNGPSIYTALQEQLGLKLVPSRAPIPVIVVDRVSRPTPD